MAKKSVTKRPKRGAFETFVQWINRGNLNNASRRDKIRRAVEGRRTVKD